MSRPATGSWGVVLGALLAAALGARQTGPAQTTPAFRSSTDLVRVDVVVVDKQGNAVKGLTAADFTLFDRKKPQMISAFAEESHDTAATASHASAAHLFPPTLKMDVATNQMPPDDRLVIMVVDDLHMYNGRTDRAKALAREVLTKLGADAAVALLFTSGEHSTQVTQQSSEILAAVDTLRGRRMIPRPIEAFDNLHFDASNPMDRNLQNFYDDMQVYKTLQDAGRILGTAAADRKAFVLISEGIGKDLTGVFDGGLADQTPCEMNNGVQPTGPNDPCYHDVALRQMMAPLRKSNVTVFGLDPRGKVTSEQLMRECFGYTGDGDDPCLGGGATPPDWSSWVRQAQHGLEITSKATGGIAVTNTDDFSAGIDRIVNDIDHYYLLGFRPADPTGKGFRQIEVKVNRPDVTVRARNGYEAGVDATPASKNKDPLAKLVEGLLPTSDLPLRLFAAPLPPMAGQKTARVAVALEITAPVRALIESDQKLHDEVSYEVFVIDDKKSKVTSRSAHAARLVLTSANSRGQLPETVTYQVPLAFDLPPGEYQFRASATSKKLDKGGSVFLTVIVPDFAKVDLAVGGIAVGYADGAHVPVGHLTTTTGPTRVVGSAATLPPAQLAAMRAVDNALPFDPSLSREFAPTDTMRVYAEVWRTSSAAATITVALMDASDRIVKSSTHDLAANAPGRVDLRLSLTDVAPGAYRLRVTAADSKHSAMREVGIVIR